MCSKREIKFATDHLTKNAEVFFRTPFRERTNVPNVSNYDIFKIINHLLFITFFFEVLFEVMDFFKRLNVITDWYFCTYFALHFP